VAKNGHFVTTLTKETITRGVDFLKLIDDIKRKTNADQNKDEIYNLVKQKSYASIEVCLEIETDSESSSNMEVDEANKNDGVMDVDQQSSSDGSQSNMEVDQQSQSGSQTDSGSDSDEPSKFNFKLYNNQYKPKEKIRTIGNEF
jgi:hypothetical protein